MKKVTVGSVCSGIDAASVAWNTLDFNFKWFSEIASFPSKVLAEKYPNIPNLGDMCKIPHMLKNGKVELPDLICGGTPCQAFSLAGWKRGLDDHRGNLTLKFVDIIDANDCARKKRGQAPTMVLWENVEGVLRDKTNAFGCFLASLLGLDTEVNIGRWPSAGILKGPKRNIAWRVLDAKYFGLPQQRKRLYLLAGGKDFLPEDILFDHFPTQVQEYQTELISTKGRHSIEIFRSYTDCLYAAYGTKWNGNAAAYNGSLFVAQNRRLRRFTPLECERLMGFPDNYTNLIGAKPTNRYQAVGNSWAVPVIKWLGERILKHKRRPVSRNLTSSMTASFLINTKSKKVEFYPINSNLLSNEKTLFKSLGNINGSQIPEAPVIGSLFDIIDTEAAENFYITPAGCGGIIRRKTERKMSINPRLESILTEIASQWCPRRIEAVSRIQKRGRFSINNDSLDTAKAQKTA